MSQDLIKADDLARELGVDVAELYAQALLGSMPAPYWRRDEVTAWVADWPASRKAVKTTVRAKKAGVDHGR